jgi:hypothetical protein
VYGERDKKKRGRFVIPVKTGIHLSLKQLKVMKSYVELQKILRPPCKGGAEEDWGRACMFYSWSLVCGFVRLRRMIFEI